MLRCLLRILNLLIPIFYFHLQFVEANKDKKGQPKSKEPARLKTHWDFVIEEMTWLAKVNIIVVRFDFLAGLLNGISRMRHT